MVGRTQRILRKYSSPPWVVTPAASSQWAKNIDRHFISNCHVIHLGGGSFSARLRSNFHCDFCPPEINIVVRMSAQHPSGPTKQWFPMKCKYSCETAWALVAANS